MKPTIDRPGDCYEREAERVAEQIMRTADSPVPTVTTTRIQRRCAKCEDETPLQRRGGPEGAGGSGALTPRAEAKVASVGLGHPLTDAQRAFFEPRFGVSFDSVRLHTDGSADTAARAVGAQAYTLGPNVVFRRDRYAPDTFAGRHVLAHELTHVVQQGAASSAGHRFVGSRQAQVTGVGALAPTVQRYPGDSMSPPGDCSWASYLILRGSVETAKAVVSTLGACSGIDSCLFLAAKIAAITSEIAARVSLDTTCFKGGDSGHRQQVQDKVNMMNRCYRFFSRSNCSPELIAAMEAVVAAARATIAAATVALAIALIAALVLAIIALAEVITALLAAAAAATAEAAAAAAALVAIVALLTVIQEELMPEGPSGA